MNEKIVSCFCKKVEISAFFAVIIGFKDEP